MITDESGAYLPAPHITRWAGLKAFAQIFPVVIIGGLFRWVKSGRFLFKELFTVIWKSSLEVTQSDFNFVAECIFSKYGAAFLEEYDLFVPDDDDDDDDDDEDDD